MFRIASGPLHSLDDLKRVVKLKGHQAANMHDQDGRRDLVHQH